MWIVRGLVVWLIIMMVETLHGIVRQALLAPTVGDFSARQISVFTGAALILIVTVLFIRWIGVKSPARLMLLGAVWVALTIAFELLLGRLVFDLPWDRLLEDYDLRHGGLMPIGLLVMGLVPLIAARWRGRRSAR